jgi:putative ABC transport system ATP-binding protein
MIELKNVIKRYEGKRTVHALRGVSFKIQRGDMVAAMGPSGCGKSTLLNIIGGLDRPSEGSVVVDGVELSSLDDNALTRLRREKIGFIFQFFNLLPTLTAIENVALPLHLAGKGKKGSAARARELLKIVGLEDRQDHLPDELSGGEQQRVAMARALALSPPLILADEPTGNLDSESGRQVLVLFKRLQSQFKTTVLMVTHDSTAAGFCDRIIRMRDGSLLDEAKQP